MSRDEEDVFRTRDETHGLDLWTVAVTVTMPGAGQVARQEARARQGLEASYRRIALALEGLGPMTRSEIAAATGIPVNGINPRISEMRARTDAYRVVTDGRRGGESIVHLARIFRPSED